MRPPNWGLDSDRHGARLRQRRGAKREGYLPPEGTRAQRAGLHERSEEDRGHPLCGRRLKAPLGRNPKAPECAVGSALHRGPPAARRKDGDRRQSTTGRTPRCGDASARGSCDAGSLTKALSSIGGRVRSWSAAALRGNSAGGNPLSSPRFAIRSGPLPLLPERTASASRRGGSSRG